ncbi:putative leucine-rich repeat-containing, plant-type, leucine-rich repeat domain superfamily [Helianthus debilis subsp. tardiflorus]
MLIYPLQKINTILYRIMGDNICHKPFIPRVFFVVSLVLVFVWFETTTATSLSHQASNYKCIDKERHALLHFKTYIHYDPGEFLSTWTREEEEEEATGNCCEWYGVTCNNKTGHVTALDLADGYLEDLLLAFHQNELYKSLGLEY